MASTEEVTYLILYGSTQGKRKIIHIAHERDGEQVPRCNSHYPATQDNQPRTFRVAEGEEREYRVCRRCEAWKGWVW